MLEVRVTDHVSVCDDLEKTIEFIIEQVKAWHSSGMNEPLSVVVENAAGRAPPALEINVVETVKTKAVFG